MGKDDEGAFYQVLLLEILMVRKVQRRADDVHFIFGQLRHQCVQRTGNDAYVEIRIHPAVVANHLGRGHTDQSGPVPMVSDCTLPFCSCKSSVLAFSD